ncbi:MAG TPA: 4-hydroxy-tetrahydrodipicolinate reductase [Negativicutes bacterium]|nr:4-hydroxy-tetrahydrodipicolinate reductase [Negativicutes bacterium]
MIRVMVSGANGRMGREVLGALSRDSECEIVATVDLKAAWEDVGEILGLGKSGVKIEADLEAAIISHKPQVMVDFTHPKAVVGNVMTALRHGVIPVVGTTGITESDLSMIRSYCEEHEATCFICPNFSIGAVLMMRFAQEAARYLPHCEIIEMHHDQKLDAPSGTALLTAKMIAGERDGLKQGHPDEEEKIPGARGAEYEGFRIHSVRLPGYVAHQEVIFGGVGQILTIRHDSLARESFMPGVVLACKKIIGRKGLVVGLDQLLGE